MDDSDVVSSLRGVLRRRDIIMDFSTSLLALSSESLVEDDSYSAKTFSTNSISVHSSFVRLTNSTILTCFVLVLNPLFSFDSDRFFGMFVWFFAFLQIFTALSGWLYLRCSFQRTFGGVYDCVCYDRIWKRLSGVGQNLRCSANSLCFTWSLLSYWLSHQRDGRCRNFFSGLAVRLAACWRLRSRNEYFKAFMKPW